jgi:hypothetical protein
VITDTGTSGRRGKRSATKALRILNTITKLAATARERPLTAGRADDLAAILGDARSATERWLAGLSRPS